MAKQATKWLQWVGCLSLTTGVVFSAYTGDRKAEEIPITEKKLEQIAQKAAEKAAQKTAAQILKQINNNNTKSNNNDNDNKKDTSITSQQPSKLPQILPIKKQAHLMGIGSGAVGGNYYVLGELVGGVVSHPIGSLPCGQGGTCGVPNLQVQNITSAGSMANLNALKDGKIATGFVQSDIAYWAYTGSGTFEKKMPDLRAIASLYPEAVHIVVKKSLNLGDVAELKGKRVSIGARNSGTLSQARLVLGAYKLSEDDMQTVYLNNQQGIKKLKDDELDAMFFSVGAPAPALTQLFEESDEFTLLSLSNAAQKEIFHQERYFSSYVIPSGVYPKVGETTTVSVFALWLCSAKTDKNLVYQMTKALWSDTARQLLDSSYIGRTIVVDNSLKGIGIPLHDGAKKYYDEIGKRY